jgi:predicted RNA binding protein YcfA (HicA-like mRNA interferase family)
MIYRSFLPQIDLEIDHQLAHQLTSSKDRTSITSSRLHHIARCLAPSSRARRSSSCRDQIPQFLCGERHATSAIVRIQRGRCLSDSSLSDRHGTGTGAVAVKVREIIKKLEADRWKVARQRGSHRQFKQPTKTGSVTVAGKPGDDVALGTLNSIWKQAGLKP